MRICSIQGLRSLWQCSAMKNEDVWLVLSWNWDKNISRVTILVIFDSPKRVQSIQRNVRATLLDTTVYRQASSWSSVSIGRWGYPLSLSSVTCSASSSPRVFATSTASPSPWLHCPHSRGYHPTQWHLPHHHRRGHPYPRRLCLRRHIHSRRHRHCWDLHPRKLRHRQGYHPWLNCHHSQTSTFY